MDIGSGERWRLKGPRQNIRYKKSRRITPLPNLPRRVPHTTPFPHTPTHRPPEKGRGSSYFLNTTTAVIGVYAKGLPKARCAMGVGTFRLFRCNIINVRTWIQRRWRWPGKRWQWLSTIDNRYLTFPPPTYVLFPEVCVCTVVFTLRHHTTGIS